MELIILAFVLLLFMLLFYRAFGSDITGPTFLMHLGYIITTIFAIYNLQRWKTELHWLIIPIILVGLFFFGAGEYICKRIKRRNNIDYDHDIHNQLSNLCIKSYDYKIVIVVLFCAIATFMLYREVVRVAFSNYREWGNLIYNYRKNRGETQINSIARIANYATRSFAFVYLFAFVNNITEYQKIHFKDILRHSLLLIPGVFFMIQSIMLGGRLGIISFVISFVVMLNLCIRYKRNKPIFLNFSRLIKILFAAIIISGFFYYVQEMVGRQQVSFGPLDYISTYLGGSIDLFSQYLRSPADIGNVETFAGLVDNAQHYLHILNNVGYSTTHEFRYSATGALIGNIYTGFRNYFHDLGIAGVVLFSLMLSIIFCSVYYHIIRYKRLRTRRLTLIIIYSSEAYCLLFHFFTDYFFLNISLNKVINYTLIYIATALVFGNKLRYQTISRYQNKVDYPVKK